MPSSLKQLEFDRQLDLMKIREFRKSGDLEMLSKLYEKYTYLVYGIGLKYFNDRVKAQDLVMQIFEKLTIQAVKQEINNFRGWLFVAARNFCVAELNKVEGHVNVSAGQITIESLVELYPLDDNKRITKEVLDCISKLKDQQRDCIELFYIKKKCYRDIAENLGIDVASVKNNILSGKKSLKICLNK